MECTQSRRRARHAAPGTRWPHGLRRRPCLACRTAHGAVRTRRSCCWTSIIADGQQTRAGWGCGQLVDRRPSPLR
ncbi:alkaline nuclease [Xanthomonas oryzae pv. oryzicola BLS256]|uniref:Alkaline nuclease n=1 Tax=Xanthomonas oryzae pv. oryzicola (strain BLS256) TaxID=383407 RepID=G7TLG8_XANOB|nr:alkaline nuclease [Xanthomonas oryzae pv. oryzicola BLS256]QEO99600.1 hypothetical protein XOCgx_4613 [Xanthomonas oryzae pv. oryzicola]